MFGPVVAIYLEYASNFCSKEKLNGTSRDNMQVNIHD